MQCDHGRSVRIHLIIRPPDRVYESGPVFHVLWSTGPHRRAKQRCNADRKCFVHSRMRSTVATVSSRYVLPLLVLASSALLHAEMVSVGVTAGVPVTDAVQGSFGSNSEARPY